MSAIAVRGLGQAYLVRPYQQSWIDAMQAQYAAAVERAHARVRSNEDPPMIGVIEDQPAEAPPAEPPVQTAQFVMEYDQAAAQQVIDSGQQPYEGMVPIIRPRESSFWRTWGPPVVAVIGITGAVILLTR